MAYVVEFNIQPPHPYASRFDALIHEADCSVYTDSSTTKYGQNWSQPFWKLEDAEEFAEQESDRVGYCPSCRPS